MHRWMVFLAVASMAGVGCSSKTAPKGPEDLFYGAMSGFYARYEAAENDIRRSEIHDEARKYDKEFFARTGNVITRWRGTVTGIDFAKTLGVAVGIGPEIGRKPRVRFKQGYSLISELNIQKDSPLFRQARELSEGGCVVFSGKVDPAEASWSKSGAMEAPEYGIEFSALEKCPN